MAPKSRRAKKMVAPDGGWGWMVVMGVSISNFSTRTLEPSFGLLFGDLLKELKVETTGAAIIMSTMDAMINLSGMFVGPLMRKYGFRKVALFGSVLSFVGMMCTAPAASMAHILITYSIIKGLGAGFVWSSTLVALNHYFAKRRGQAVGLSMAATAFGLMVMPQAVQLLLEAYSFSGAVLVLSAISLNSFVGAALLQPVKWHMIPAAEEPQDLKGTESEQKSQEGVPMLQIAPNIEITGADDEAGTERKGQGQGHAPHKSTARRYSGKRKGSIMSSMSSMDFTGSAYHIDTNTSDSDEDDDDDDSRKKKNMIGSSFPTNDINANGEQLKNTIEKKKKGKRSFFQQVVKFMDLDLLKDPIYLNIVFGLSLFFVAELNFKMVIPFFMADLGYSKVQTAFCLSMMALSDLVARLVLPPICDRINITRRTLFAVSAIFLGISRSILAQQTEYAPLLTMIVISGLFRGCTVINSTLSISEHCTLDKLAAAFGLHMVAKGIFTASLGPLIGAIRDLSGSYPICIHAQTVLIFACPIAWGVEYLIRKKNVK